MEGYIQLGTQRLHYHAAGNGPQVLLAFHGYGNDAQLMLELAAHLPATYTMISINLPHHGRSRWHDDVPLTRADLNALVAQLLEQYGVQQLTLLGYSIGGRVCMCVAEAMPQCIRQMILLAPDGLRFNAFYYFVTRTRIGSALFNGFLKNGDKYLHWITRLRKWRLLDASRERFAAHYIQTPERREQLLRIWPNLRYLIPNTARVKRNIRQYRIAVHIFMGRHDRIIPVKLAAHFSKNMDTVKVHILDEGHRLPQAHIWKHIINCLS